MVVFDVLDSARLNSHKNLWVRKLYYFPHCAFLAYHDTFQIPNCDTQPKIELLRILA